MGTTILIIIICVLVYLFIIYYTTEQKQNVRVINRYIPITYLDTYGYTNDVFKPMFRNNSPWMVSRGITYKP